MLVNAEIGSVFWNIWYFTKINQDKLCEIILVCTLCLEYKSSWLKWWILCISTLSYIKTCWPGWPARYLGPVILVLFIILNESALPVSRETWRTDCSKPPPLLCMLPLLLTVWQWQHFQNLGKKQQTDREFSINGNWLCQHFWSIIEPTVTNRTNSNTTRPNAY